MSNIQLIYLFTTILFIVCSKVHSRICTFEERYNPSTEKRQWSLKEELYLCQGVVPPYRGHLHSYTRRNWRKEKLDVLLNRAYCNCKNPLGLQNGKILDDQISVSSFIGSNSTGNSARLHYTNRWVPKTDDQNKWIRIDLNSNYSVSGIITQGWTSWVETLRIKYQTTDGSLVNVINTAGMNKVFETGKDGRTPVTILFDQPVYTSIIQVEPVTCNDPKNKTKWCPMRLEILGC